MKRTPLMIWFAALALVAATLAGAGAHAEPMTWTGNFDIGAWMEQARDTWDFDDEDGVLLLEGMRLTWLEDGRLREEHHRVVWIATDHALEQYADLRVPWDKDRQTLKVNALRVWRDDRWVRHRPTAVVETTPFQFRTAPDYTNIRETMLLHDGIERPCILECDYVVEDRMPFRAGFDGQWLFRHNNPALNSWVIIEVPEGTELELATSPGVQVTDETPGGPVEGFDVYSMRMQRMEPAPLPETADPAAYLPHVQWSSYASWNELGDQIKAAFVGKQRLGDALEDSLANLLEGANSNSEKAHRIAEFVRTHQRTIGYDPSWFRPQVRAAERTYATGYGVAIDQAVLAASLMKQAGFEVWPVLLADGYGDVDEGVATTARFGAPGVWVSGAGVEAYFDAARGSLHNGLAPIYGRTVWLPGFEENPRVRWAGEGQPSELTLALELAWDAESERWTGDGYYEAGGGFSPYDKMEGGGDRSDSHLDRVVGGVISGADVTGFSPLSFDRFTVATDFTFEAPAAERDDLGRLPVVIGSPGGGILDMLPGDVRLHLAERGSPAILPGSGAQTVKLTLDLSGLELVRAPEQMSEALSNDAGYFELSAVRDGDELTITRTLAIDHARYEPVQWPALREILLEEVDPANRTVLLK